MFSEIVMIIEIEYLLNNGTDFLIIPLKGTEPPQRHRIGKISTDNFQFYMR